MITRAWLRSWMGLPRKYCSGARGYGPRHLDLHPTQPWMYVSVETQNQMQMHRMQGGKPLPDVAFSKTTLLEPSNIRSRQAASAVHVHPNGLSSRATS